MIKKGWILFLAVLLTAGFAGTSYAASVDLSGQVRVRAEYRENFDFDNSPSAVDENAWVEQRTRLTANATVSDDVSAKFTIQDSRVWGDELSTADTAADWETLDMHEGYLQVGNLLGSGLTMKMGRQKIVKGDQRILGGFEWNNHARAFDGIALIHSNDQATITAAWVKLSEAGNVGKSPGTPSDHDTDLWVAYAEIKSIANNQIDVYALLLRDGDPVGLGLSGPLATSLYTIGARLAGNVENVGVDYTVEIPFQFGDVGHQSVGTADDSFGGYAIFVKGGYTVPGESKIRLGAEYNLVSGDDQNTTDGDMDAFVNLGLGTDHLHYGYMDVVNPATGPAIISGVDSGGRSIWGLNAKANVLPDLSLYVAYWSTTLPETATGDADEVGSELNLQAKYNLAENTSLVAGYGRFFTGDAIDNAVTAGGGSPEDQDWAFAMFTTNF